MTNFSKVVNVVLDVPLNNAFSYTTTETISIGSRVLVEFHRKKVIGFVLENDIAVANLTIDIAKLKPVLQIFSEKLSNEIIDLINFTSKYYAYPLGQTLFSAIPTAYRQPVTIKLSKSSVTVKHEINLPKKKQKLQLTEEQQQVINNIKDKFNTYHPAILYGITGSGKTEVYLELIAAVIINKKQALVLVPEINLTPQLLARFKRRFKDAIIHTLTSSSTINARTKGYLEAENGTANIIIGTRLAVFTPFKKLGLIVIDEEHDNSFKQNDGLRYNARDLAVYRAKYHNIPIILGSATPALETLYNYKLSRYTLYKLTNRAVSSSSLPVIKLIDLNTNHVTDGVSEVVITAIEKRLKAKELSLVFINRRGYAPIVNCYDCGFIFQCNNCSTNMVFHKGETSNHLKCHHCGTIQKKINTCPKCQSQHLFAVGIGSQKVETTLMNKFPSARICRIDQDTTNSKKAWADLYNKIHNNEVDILVGTQMLAKGHDFHNITLVVGLNVDTSLYSYDFRASELLFTQLTQVSGRAGRGDLAGEVLLQTNYPKHPLFQFLLKHDFSAFANYTLKERKLLHLPPYSHYVLLRASGSDLAKTMEYLSKIVTAANKSIKIDGVIQYPVVPAIIQRLKNRERVQSLIFASDRNNLHKYISGLMAILSVNKPKLDIIWHLDIDPIEI